MGVFVRAVVTGFAFSLGSALFKKVSPRIGLEDPKAAKDNPSRQAAGEDEVDDTDDAEEAEDARRL